MGTPDSPLLIGEVHTGLLQHSSALPPSDVVDLLRLRPGEGVRTIERPMRYAVSPVVLTGVDCRLGTAGGVRVVGTLLSRSTVIGGHVLQASSVARIRRGARGRRAEWSRYLAAPGELETMGRPIPEQVTLDFLAEERSAAGLDLAALNVRLMDTVQASSGLDRRPPFRTARTRLRWVAELSGTSRIHFGLEETNLRSLRLGIPESELAGWSAVASFCEDIALHDWLLSCLLQMMDRVGVGRQHEEGLAHRLQPIIDHLLHLWMPASRADEEFLPLWLGLDRRVGFSRQWETSANWIRDQIGVGYLYRRPDRLW
jgi:hypothetical protein